MSSSYRFSQGSRKPTALGTGCIRAFFTPFLLAGLAVLWLATISPLLQCAAALRWEETPCIIDSSRVDVVVSTDHDSRPTYRPLIAYHYEFHGARYASKRYNFVTSSSGFRTGIQTIVDRYSPGQQTICYVNPGHPTEAVISRSLSGGMLVGLFGLPFAIIGGLGMWFAGHFNSPQQTARKNAVPTFTHSTGEPVELKPQVTPGGKFLTLLAFGIVWNGFISIFVYLVFLTPNHQGTPLFAKIFVGLFAAIGVLILLAAIGSFFALFNPRIVLRTRAPAVPLGSALQFEWSISGQADRLRKLSIVLVGREEAVHSSGENSDLVTHVFAEIPVLETMEHEIVNQGQARVTIPSDLMHTFNSGNNRITWHLQVRGDIPKSPPLQQDHTINVLPHGATA